MHGDQEEVHEQHSRSTVQCRKLGRAERKGKTGVTAKRMVLEHAANSCKACMHGKPFSTAYHQGSACMASPSPPHTTRGAHAWQALLHRIPPGERMHGKPFSTAYHQGSACMASPSPPHTTRGAHAWQALLHCIPPGERMHGKPFSTAYHQGSACMASPSPPHTTRGVHAWQALLHRIPPGERMSQVGPMHLHCVIVLYYTFLHSPHGGLDFNEIHRPHQTWYVHGLYGVQCATITSCQGWLAWAKHLTCHAPSICIVGGAYESH